MPCSRFTLIWKLCHPARCGICMQDVFALASWSPMAARLTPRTSNDANGRNEHFTEILRANILTPRRPFLTPKPTHIWRNGLTEPRICFYGCGTVASRGTGQQSMRDLLLVQSDALLELITNHERSDLKYPEGNHGRDCADCAKFAAQLAIQVKHRYSDARSEIKRLVETFNSDSPWRDAVRIDLLRFVAVTRGLHDAELRRWAEEACWNLSHDTEYRGARQFAIQFAELGEKLARRLEPMGNAGLSY